LERRGLLFIIVGPSGAGKNTIMHEVLDHQNHGNLRQLPTMTTRNPRSNEVEGVQHYFVTEARFQEMINSDALVEYQRIHNAGLYGTPRFAVEEAFERGEDLIADIDVKGALALQAAYPDNTVLIFVAPPSREALEERIRERNSDTEAQIAVRLSRAEMEMAYIPWADFLIVNDNLEHSIALVERIIHAKRDGEALEQGNPLRVLAWITKNGHPDRVLTLNDKLPQLSVTTQGDMCEAFRQALGVVVIDYDMQEVLRLSLDQQGQLNVAVLVTADAVNEPAGSVWQEPEHARLPFHLKVPPQEPVPAIPG
jgi:guanylate kinase